MVPTEKPQPPVNLWEQLEIYRYAHPPVEVTPDAFVQPATHSRGQKVNLRAHGTGSIYKRKASSKWQMCYYDPRLGCHIRLSTGEFIRERAEEKLNRILADIYNKGVSDEKRYCRK